MSWRNREPFDYARWGYELRAHHVRYKAYVETHGFTCQECGGSGGDIEPVTDEGQGPWFDCGFCEGTGLVTRWMRGQWLRWKKQERKQAARKERKAA